MVLFCVCIYKQLPEMVSDIGYTCSAARKQAILYTIHSGSLTTSRISSIAFFLFLVEFELHYESMTLAPDGGYSHLSKEHVRKFNWSKQNVHVYVCMSLTRQYIQLCIHTTKKYFLVQWPDDKGRHLFRYHISLLIILLIYHGFLTCVHAFVSKLHTKCNGMISTHIPFKLTKIQ